MAFLALRHVGPRNHVLDGVRDPPTGRGNLGIVRPVEKHWETAEVYAANRVTESSTTA